MLNLKKVISRCEISNNETSSDDDDFRSENQIVKQMRNFFIQPNRNEESKQHENNIKLIENVNFIYKQIVLKSIDESISIINGNSKLFNKENLEKYEVNEPSDLLLLFLPNFSFSSPFRFLLSCNYFDVLNRLVEKIEENDLFSKFLNNDMLIDKLIKMFYILSIF